MMLPKPLVAAALLPLATIALPQKQARSTGGPLVRVADTGRTGSATLVMDGAYEFFEAKYDHGRPFHLRDLPIPGRRSIDLELRPVSALAPGARGRAVQPDGSEILLEPTVVCFSGLVEGGGYAFLGVTQGEIQGYLDHEGERYFLSGGDRRGPGRVLVTHAGGLGGTLDWGECDPEDGRWPELLTVEPEIQALELPMLRTADVFFEADHQLRSRYASDQECFDYVVLLVTAVSEIYRRDLGARVNVPDGYLRVWNTVPPWGWVTGLGSLSAVYEYWMSDANPLKNLPRAAVHVMTSPVFGGTARGSGGLCNNTRAYEISSLKGAFPYPVEHKSRENWDLFVVSHELGHTFGSVHAESYSPPIECGDGSGPDMGTIMSYCHNRYGLANVGMRFHPRVQQKILQVMDRWGCMREEPLILGDYDADGDLTDADVTALSGLLNQGFRSLGAEQVMDMNADGQLTQADLDLLSNSLGDGPSQLPASVAARNGHNVNDLCLEALDRPVLGTTWNLRVFTGGSGIQTLVVGFDRPLDGLGTPRGELLVRTPTLGGVKLFNDSSVSKGKFADHLIPLPIDASLQGLEVFFQAVVLEDANEHYCNALDAVLSSY